MKFRMKVTGLANDVYSHKGSDGILALCKDPTDAVVYENELQAFEDRKLIIPNLPKQAKFEFEFL